MYVFQTLFSCSWSWPNGGCEGLSGERQGMGLLLGVRQDNWLPLEPCYISRSAGHPLGHPERPRLHATGANVMAIDPVARGLGTSGRPGG